GRTGVITKSIRDYSPDDNSVYILVDDALFFVGLNGIDLIKFFNGIKITKPQILSGYKIISEKNHKTFINPKRGYQIDIPNDAGVSVRAIRTALGGSSGVIDDNIAVSVSQPYFGSGPNSGIDFIITVASSSEQSVQGMINARNMTFEKNIVVDGAKAYLSHVGNLGNSFDEYPNEKVVYILKDGTLYLISVQSADYKEILAGFRFLR
ncbi:MAG: hypothetical protein HYV68_00655, partial [Candidatus Taylorbacteria bacterium]|nr:hypothetical protein [Candidatus Taylorbacteria bacterium]